MVVMMEMVHMMWNERLCSWDHANGQHSSRDRGQNESKFSHDNSLGWFAGVQKMAVADLTPNQRTAFRFRDAVKNLQLRAALRRGRLFEKACPGATEHRWRASHTGGLSMRSMCFRSQ
jgi:hypothetical protein